MSTTVIEDERGESSSKWADTAPSVHELIRKRWSPRAFSDQALSDEALRSILEAGRWAASSYNEQPWRFLVAKRSEASFQQFVELLMPFNQGWAKEAQALIITAGKKTFSHNGSPNHYALHDAGQAFANMALQATALGLHIHGMGGFDQERARQELGIPDDFEVGAAIAVGYLGSPDKLPESVRNAELAPRTRKPLQQIAFAAKWDVPVQL